MILTVTLNPSVDHDLFLERLHLHDTNRVARTERDAGGKGVNVARVATELGAETLATGFLAGGPGAYVRTVLDKRGVKHDFIEVPGETRINFSVQDSTHLPPTTFNEPGPEIGRGAMESLTEECLARAGACAWICVGGSLPPGVPTDIFRTLIGGCRHPSTSFLLDADGEAFRLGMEAGPNLVKPNNKEAGRYLGREVESTEECVQAACEILFRLKAEGGRAPIAVISRGSRGAVLASGEGILIGHSPKVEINSTIGSGDSMLGGMLWAFEAGKSLEEAFRWGLAAGAATAQARGNEIARKESIEALFPRARVDRG